MAAVATRTNRPPAARQHDDGDPDGALRWPRLRPRPHPVPHALELGRPDRVHRLQRQPRPGGRAAQERAADRRRARGHGRGDAARRADPHRSSPSPSSAIFAVLAVATWLRPLSYAFWAAGITAVLALLNGYFGVRGSDVLGPAARRHPARRRDRRRRLLARPAGAHHRRAAPSRRRRGLGVFAHEFGHDLGLPDYYDTAGGENSTAFWTLMSSGSWLEPRRGGERGHRHHARPHGPGGEAVPRLARLPDRHARSAPARSRSTRPSTR